MKKLILVIVFLIANCSVFAQKFELGKVTIDELKEVTCPKDTSAVAAFLFNRGKTYFEYSQEDGFMVKTEIEAKIKIYKKEGYEWANEKVRCFVGGVKKEKVDFNKAITYNLVNGAIEKTKLKSEGEFIEHINKYWDEKKITMPNVKQGSIIEYSYTITSPYISNLQDWDFQKSIPVNYSEFSTSIPEYYFYSAHYKGSLAPKVEKDERRKTITFYKKFGGNKDVDEVEYREFVNKYIVIDAPAMKEEAFVNNIDNYVTAVSHELISIQYPNEPFENYATSWEDVTKKIYESDDFGMQLDKKNYYEEDVKTLVQGLTTVDEKVEVIFNYVKSRMNWNKYNGIYCDNGVKKAYQDKTGNSADINLMLVSMLRFVGLESNPVLISTRSNGIAIFPSRTAFNTVIASVQNGQGLILLDATSKYSYLNILPINDLNWFGRLIKRDGTSEFVELMPSELSVDSRNLIVNIDDKGNLSGKERSQFSKYFAFKFREKSAQFSNESYLEKLEKDDNIEIADYEQTNDNNFAEPIVEKFSLKANSSADIVGGKMYFSPLFFLRTKVNPFKQETREYPIDFSFPMKVKYMVSITIPEGYAVESFPKPLSVVMDKNLASYKFMISNSVSNVIQITADLEIKSAVIPSDDYASMKDFFRIIVEKENEKVILTKI